MIFNDKFFEEIGKSPEVTNLVRGVATDVARTARATAEVDTGAYRNNIEVQIKEARYRNVALVVGTDPKTLIIEAHTHNLLRALRSVRRS